MVGVAKRHETTNIPWGSPRWLISAAQSTPALLLLLPLPLLLIVDCGAGVGGGAAFEDCVILDSHTNMVVFAKTDNGVLLVMLPLALPLLLLLVVVVEDVSLST